MNRKIDICKYFGKIWIYCIIIIFFGPKFEFSINFDDFPIDRRLNESQNLSNNYTNFSDFYINNTVLVPIDSLFENKSNDYFLDLIFGSNKRINFLEVNERDDTNSTNSNTYFETHFNKKYSHRKVRIEIM